MKVLLVILILVGASSAVPSKAFRVSWEKFKAEFQKEYADAEEAQLRRYIYKRKLAYIEKHNEEAARGVHTYTVGENQFSDMAPREVQAWNGLKPMEVPDVEVTDEPVEDQQQLGGIFSHTPSSIDWREKNAVTNVKNQRECGSCWSFSTTGAIEGRYSIAKGTLVSLSEQNLIDCAGEKYGCNGCNGGVMDGAFQYVIDNNGIDLESSYPYRGRFSDKQCKYDPKNRGATISKYKDVKRGSESSLKEAVAEGPVSIGIDASLDTFQSYKSGVYYDSRCSSSALDHGVLAVGYGNENGQDYWLVKNSWGPNWGEAGFVKIARNKKNHCGVATMASYPIV